MKKTYFFVLLTLMTITAHAQNCNCLQEYQFVKQFIEKNHGGFNTNIMSADQPAYKKFTTGLEKQIMGDTGNRYCIAYLKKYILYLKDHHSNIITNGKAVNEQDAEQLKTFLTTDAFLRTERIPIDSAAVGADLTNRKGNTPEGIYQTTDGTYTIAIIKSKTANRDYAGVILNSQAKTWVKGQVKIELKKMNDSTFEAFIYLRNHDLSYERVKIVNGSPELSGWNKLFPAKVAAKNSIATNVSTGLIDFTVLDSNTSMISIRSFSGGQSRKLDSAYKMIIPQIMKYPNLIIDVRNNGGGSDANYMALMPLIYTDTIIEDVVNTYNTAANRKAYQDYDNELQAKTNRTAFTFPLNVMKNAPENSFIAIGGSESFKRGYPLEPRAPKKIAILYNRGCASSCESLLFDAMFSKKTIFVGENSGGYTGYGNVMSIQTPCGNLLNWTTTVYRDQWKYEFDGIPPHYRVPATENDWVAYTLRLLR